MSTINYIILVDISVIVLCVLIVGPSQLFKFTTFFPPFLYTKYTNSTIGRDHRNVSRQHKLPGVCDAGTHRNCFDNGARSGDSR